MTISLTPYNNTTKPKKAAFKLKAKSYSQQFSEDKALKIVPSETNVTWEPSLCPCIDKLTLTCNHFTDGQKKTTWHILKSQAASITGADLGKRGGYGYNFRFPLEGGDGLFFVSVYPSNAKKRPFMRIEFNPNKIGPDGVHEIMYGWLDIMFDGGWEEVNEHARVSRIDFAVDLQGVQINDLIVISDYAVRSCKYDTNGYLDTYYLGAPKSQRQTRIYDRIAYLKEGNPEIDVFPPVTRIERVVRNCGWFRNLHKMNNPIKTLRIGYYDSTVSGIEGWEWKQFCAHARETTPQAALLAMPTKRAKLFRKALTENPPTWWNPEGLWKNWPIILKSAGLIINPKGPFG